MCLDHLNGFSPLPLVCCSVEMAGVGIFFQQEPQSGKVYVASIVQGGSADRSGVIRINDVIVKVDDEDVQGQPLSNLRNLILGKQGSYVVLAFRRVTGTELYYFDVELVRGTPEYFESLKKNQAIQDEKEKLLNQVRQQEAEIHQLKVQNTTMRSSGMSGASSTASGVAGGGVDALNRELEQKREKLRKMELELKDLVDEVASAGTVNLDAEGAARSIKGENKRIQETIAAAEASIHELTKRLDVDKAGWDSEKLRLEQQIADAARSKAAKIGTLTAAQEENKSLKEKVASRKAKEAAMQAKVKATLQSLVEAHKASEETVCCPPIPETLNPKPQTLKAWRGNGLLSTHS